MHCIFILFIIFTLERLVILVTFAVILVTVYHHILLCVSLSCCPVFIFVQQFLWCTFLASYLVIIAYKLNLTMVDKMFTTVVPFNFRAAHCSGVHRGSSRHCKCTECNLGVSPIGYIMAIPSVFFD